MRETSSCSFATVCPWLPREVLHPKGQAVICAMGVVVPLPPASQWSRCHVPTSAHSHQAQCLWGNAFCFLNSHLAPH
jgi:hypothetical protein